MTKRVLLDIALLVLMTSIGALGIVLYKRTVPVADFSRMEKRLRAQEAAGEVFFVGLDQPCPEYSAHLMADELGLCWAD